MIDAPGVHGALDALAARGVDCVIGGGWGIDALIGRQTRDHDDLDVIFPAELESVAIDELTGLGFTITTDWRPIRFAMTHPDGREVDLHPVTRSDDGSFVQQVFDGHLTYPPDDITEGAIAGRSVRCLSARLQLEFHTGYEPRDVDRADVTLLCAELGLIPPRGFDQTDID